MEVFTLTSSNTDLSEMDFDALVEKAEASNQDEKETADEDQEQQTNPTTEEEKNGEGEDTAETQDDESEETPEDEPDEKESGESKEESKAQGLSDEEFLKELERRGLKVAEDKKEEPKKDDKPQPWEERPDEIDEKLWNKSTPEEKFIYNSLDYITVKGKDGEELSVKLPTQLPDDFEFASKRAEAQFYSAMSAQSSEAEKLMNKITSDREQTTKAEQEKAELDAIIADVDRLQDDGIVPRIKAKPGTKEFNTDPSVQLVNKILDFRDEYNRKHKGENISSYTAGLIYKAKNPKEFETEDDIRREKQDESRTKTARRVATKTTSSQRPEYNRKAFSNNASLTDIADYYADQL
nr:MAG TPA: hypothetical protein [Caudoviricetes sp.]